MNLLNYAQIILILSPSLIDCHKDEWRRLAQIILILSPSLIDCHKDEWRRLCNEITCSNSTSQLNDDRCEHLGHIRDPFTNECITKCDSPCIDGSCSFCYCTLATNEDAIKSKCDSPCIDGSCSFCYCTLATNEDAIKSTDPVQCKRILNGTSCQRNWCKFEDLTSCDSCGNGRCTKSGYCVCDLGYRPDVGNPRICIRMAANLDCVCETFSVSEGESSIWTCLLFILLAAFLGAVCSLILLKLIDVICSTDRFNGTHRSVSESCHDASSLFKGNSDMSAVKSVEVKLV
ncbi:hypothetical protein QE152_g29431 [Popillia japonica]|uniref:Uncharacterized protein n=1 Tax=Popillia japonica TaxID=7064 RepID=A0AAW1JHN5_POPJA